MRKNRVDRIGVAERVIGALSLSVLCGVAWASPLVMRFNGGFDEFASAIVADSVGNSYIGGMAESADRKLEFAVIKYNAVGALQWKAAYSNAQHGTAGGGVVGVAVDASGNVYVSGFVYTSITLFTINRDWLVASYSPDGVERWSRRINGTANDQDSAGSIAVDAAGNVYVAGSITDTEHAGQAGWTVIKYSPNGTQLWRRTDVRADGTRDSIGGLRVDGMGNLVGVGTNQSLQASSENDIVTTKFDSSGNVLWRRSFSETAVSDDVVMDLAIDAAGSVYVTGETVASTNPELEHVPITLKYDANGAVQFVLRGDGAGGSSIEVDSVGDVLVSGTSFREGGNVGLAATSKYDSNGARRWSTPNVAGSIKVDSIGNVYAFSQVQLFTGDQSDLLTVKLNRDGANVWTHQYNGRQTTNSSSADRAVDSAMDGLGNFFVLANTMEGTQDDVLALRYAANVVPDQPPTTVSAPSNLSAAALTGRVLLTWTDNAGNESVVGIERCTGKNCTSFTVVAQVAANVTSYSDASVAPRTTYRYRVRAGRDAVVSAYSNIASVPTTRR